MSKRRPFAPTVEGGSAAADIGMAGRATALVAFHALFAIGVLERRLAAREVAQHGFQRLLAGGDPAFWLAKLVQHDETDPVAVFLVSHPSLLQLLQLELAPYRKPESGDELPVLLNHCRKARWAAAIIPSATPSP
jgi:hypothetical protein